MCKNQFCLLLSVSLAAVLLLFIASGCPPQQEAPKAAFAAAPLWGQAALPVQFVDASGSGSSTITGWEWDFGDGNTSTEQNPGHLYAEPGSYTVSLTVTSEDGTDTHQETDYIVVSENDVIAWNNAALDAVVNAGLMPPQASRALAMMHAAVYDAVNAVEQLGEPYQAVLTAPAGASKEAAAAQAAYRVLFDLFPASAQALSDQRTASLGVIPEGDAKASGTALGDDAADAILAWRADDGSQMTMMDPYIGGTAPGQWRPTPPGFLPGMFAQWMTVTPFALESSSQFLPGPPPDLASEDYAEDLEEVREIGAKTTMARTMDQSMMATFWVGMPGTIGEAGRMNVVAQQAAKARNNTLYDNARLFLLVNAALADAAIAGIDCKYTYSAWRPVTAIQEAADDGNDLTVADPAWEPYLVTPAHPEYISTHSTLTKAAAVVLAAFFGSDDADLTLAAFMDPNMTRHYTTFSQVAEEAGLSRLYGGIHFRFSYDAGVRLGQDIGTYVLNSIARPL